MAEELRKEPCPARLDASASGQDAEEIRVAVALLVAVAPQAASARRDAWAFLRREEALQDEARCPRQRVAELPALQEQRQGLQATKEDVVMASRLQVPPQQAVPRAWELPRARAAAQRQAPQPAVHPVSLEPSVARQPERAVPRPEPVQQALAAQRMERVLAAQQPPEQEEQRPAARAAQRPAPQAARVELST